MIRVASVAIAASLLLAACSSSGDTNASQPPSKPKDFCHAMQSAAAAAQPAATALDDLFAIIDSMATSASEGDIDALHTSGATSEAASQTYVEALDAAEGLAPEDIADDVAALSDYWTIYAVGMAQIAQNVPSYGKLVDQTQALATSDSASRLIEEQPGAQQRINDAYLAECAG